MSKRILIIGGYGNFGSFISEQLSAPVLDELKAMKASLTSSPFISIRLRTAAIVALCSSKWNSSGSRNTRDTGVLSTGTCMRYRGEKRWRTETDRCTQQFNFSIQNGCAIKAFVFPSRRASSWLLER